MSIRALIAGRRGLLGAFVATLISMTCVGSASAASWFEKNFGLSGPRFDAIVPSCDSFWALGKIKARFAEKEGTFWVSDLKIVNFDRIHETAFRPWAEQAIPRRFCSGLALISDGRWRPVHYSIIEDGGMIGATFGVEWCVVGIDRNWAYNPACREAKP